MKVFEGVISTFNNIVKVLKGSEVGSTEVSVNTTDNLYDYEYLKLEQTRKAKYKDYKDMDDSYGSEISVALDAYADTALKQSDPEEDLIKIKSENNKIQEIIKDAMSNVNLQAMLWSWLRGVDKYGDLFLEPIFDKIGRLVRVKALPPDTIFANVDKYGVPKSYPYIQKIDDELVAEFREWQIIHIILRREADDVYGTSILQPGRMPYKKLQYMEDAMVIQRITRSRRNLHKIDVTGKTFDDAVATVETYKKQFKQLNYVNSVTGKFDLRKLAMKPSEDFFMGVTAENKQAGIEILKESEIIDITDILYMYAKFIISLKVPRHLMGINFKGLGEQRPDSFEALFFQSSVRRTQIALIYGLYELFDLVLMERGINPKKKENNYEIMFPKLSTTDELIASRVKLIESTAARNYLQLDVVDREFVLRDILKLTPERVKAIMARMEKAEPHINKNVPTVNPDSGDDKKNKGKGGGTSGSDQAKRIDDPPQGQGNKSAPTRSNPAQKEDIEKIRNELLNNSEIADLIAEINGIVSEEHQYELSLEHVKRMYKKHNKGSINE